MEQALSNWVFTLVEPQSTIAQDTRAYTHKRSTNWIHNMCFLINNSELKSFHIVQKREDYWASCSTHKQNEHTESHAMEAERVVDSTIRILLRLTVFTSIRLCQPSSSLHASPDLRLLNGISKFWTSINQFIAAANFAPRFAAPFADIRWLCANTPQNNNASSHESWQASSIVNFPHNGFYLSRRAEQLMRYENLIYIHKGKAR